MKEQRENWIQRRVKNSIRIIWCAEKMNNEMNYNGLVVVQINQFYCCVCGNLFVSGLRDCLGIQKYHEKIKKSNINLDIPCVS